MRVHQPELPDKLLEQALEAFYWWRGVGGLQKKPSTSELIDWVQALAMGGVDPKSLRERLPFLGVLLKKDKDVEARPGGGRRRQALRRR